MTLVGLTSLLVGGIGVANGVRAWVHGAGAQHRHAALPGCGAGAGVRGVPGAGDGAGGAGGVLAGLAVGAALPALAAAVRWPGCCRWCRSGPFILARCCWPRLYGLLTAAAFSLWPLGRAMRIPGGALFRDALLPATYRRRGWLVAANAAALGAGRADRGDRRARAFASCFCVGGRPTLAAVPRRRLGGDAAGASPPAPRWPWARLGLATFTGPARRRR